MIPYARIVPASFLLLLLVTNAASAQYPGNPYGGGGIRFGPPTPGGPYGPGLSPYLNLLRGGPPAVNYYNGVLSERDRRMFQQQAGQSIIGLQQEINTPASETDDLLLSPLSGTGHPTAFGYSGSYFPPTVYPGRGPGAFSQGLRPRR
jgi:hypothetical protein